VDVPPDPAADEASRLRRCLSDLVSIVALPALWIDGAPSRIVGTLLDGLLGMLDAAFVFARLNDGGDGSPAEVARVSEPWIATIRPRQIGQALDTAQREASTSGRPLTRLGIGGAQLAVACARLGLQGDIGVVIVGSERMDFPVDSERLILEVAANQTTMGLQQARSLSEQRRVAAELDGHVAQRTRELAAANDELKKEIAERLRTEQALRAHALNFQITVDSIPGMVHTMTATGAVEFVNHQVLSYFGKTLEELNDWSVLVHPDDRSRVVDLWTRSVATGEPFDAEHRVLRADGTYGWLHARGLPLRDTSGSIVRWYNLLTDIDERKRAEDELRRSEAFLAEAQQLSRVGSFSWHLATDDIMCSEQWHRIFEIDRDVRVSLDMVGARIHPDDLPAFAAEVERSRRDGGDVQLEIRLQMPDRTVKHIHVVAHCRGDHDQREYIGAVQDVTQRRRSEEALAQVRSDLAHVARVTSLGVLTASIAHEVNQPLSGIITNSATCIRMLDADPPNVDGARETARRTIRDGNRASEVVGRLRALFSRKDFTLEPLDLNEATREVIALSLGDLQRNRILLQSVLAEDLPTVTADRIQLQQVVLNLLRNASDAMVDVHDRPRLLLITTEREGDAHVRLSVRDAGTGIAPQSLDSLFDAFYTTKRGGMGVGLFVSRSIIERHDGRLWVEPNRDGPGAIFAFSIPSAHDNAGDGPA